MLALIVGLMMVDFNPAVLTVPIVVATTTPQQVWMKSLANCESTGSTTIRVWDTNNRWSVGKYQYQYATWLLYSEKFGTTRENITDGDLQDEVTQYILETKGYGDWWNCGRKTEKLLGAYPVSESSPYDSQSR